MNLPKHLKFRQNFLLCVDRFIPCEKGLVLIVLIKISFVLIDIKSCKCKKLMFRNRRNYKNVIGSLLKLRLGEEEGEV